MNRKLSLFMWIIITTGFIAGCAGTGGGLGSIDKTARLMPGLSAEQVQALLGDPSQSQFISGKWVWKYNLHQYFKGWVPYYLVFDAQTSKLDSWYASEAEYLQQQQLLIQGWQQSQHQGSPEKGSKAGQGSTFEDRMESHGISVPSTTIYP